jgi:antirestriction protein ArdC
MTNNGQLHEQVNQTIIDALTSKTVPWRGEHGFLRGIWSRRRYDGLNAILLLIAERRRQFNSPWWGTRAQWEALGGSIKEHPGTDIVLAKPDTVYNLSQVDGNFPILQSPMLGYAAADQIIASTKADIRFTHDRIAEYHYPESDADGDFIKLCHREHFERGPGGLTGYYHTVFHELAHWSEPRCNWWTSKDEIRELRAELAADFLTTELELPSCPYHTHRHFHHHIDPWVREMTRDPRMIFEVATAAAEAVDYVLALSGLVEGRE